MPTERKRVDENERLRWRERMKATMGFELVFVCGCLYVSICECVGVFEGVWLCVYVILHLCALV